MATRKVDKHNMTNNKQQTAVEWLQSIELERDLTLADWKQAKEMEKDQINDAYFQGFEDNVWDSLDDNFNLEYYNETYGGGEQ